MFTNRDTRPWSRSGWERTGAKGSEPDAASGRNHTLPGERKGRGFRTGPRLREAKARAGCGEQSACHRHRAGAETGLGLSSEDGARTSREDRVLSRGLG